MPQLISKVSVGGGERPVPGMAAADALALAVLQAALKPAPSKDPAADRIALAGFQRGDAVELVLQRP